MRRDKTVLISGAGIAGPTLAYWLLRAGMEPTIVEAARQLRTGGYMIDFWGLGFAVAEAMGLGSRLREIGYAMREVTLVDEHGHPTAHLTTDAMREAIGGRYVSLLRGDLARELYGSIAGRVEVIFGDEITFLAQDDEKVQVGFAHGGPRRFDLVVGADGVHSNVRRLTFGRRSKRAPERDLVARYSRDCVTKGIHPGWSSRRATAMAWRIEAKWPTRTRYGKRPTTRAS